MSTALGEARRLPRDVLDHLRSMPRSAQPIDVLRTLVSLLGSYDREAASADPGAELRKAVRLTGAIAAGLAAFERIRRQLPPLEPRADLGHAASFLWLLQGEPPDKLAARAFDVALVLHMEHSSTPRPSPRGSPRRPSPTSTPPSPPRSPRSRGRCTAAPTRR